MTPEQMINQIIDTEGGYVDHPSDRGGPTKFGITMPALQQHTGKPSTVADIKALTKEMAHVIYMTDYYLRPKIDQLPQQLQPFMLDSCINHGPTTAIRLLQETLNQFHCWPGPLDGIIGPKTLQAITDFCAANPHGDGIILLLDCLVTNRVSFYQAIALQYKSQNVFLNGWTARAEKFRPQ